MGLRIKIMQEWLESLGFKFDDIKDGLHDDEPVQYTIKAIDGYVYVLVRPDNSIRITRTKETTTNLCDPECFNIMKQELTTVVQVKS